MRVAVFGGTFDPVHLGHVRMAKHAIHEFSLDKLIVVPNGNPPHKTDMAVTDFLHRYNMARLAFDEEEGIEVSDYEGSEGFSYSLHTMRHFRKKYGEDTFFIIGADSLLTIHRWHEYETLLLENDFIVFRRRGDSELDAVANRYRQDFKSAIRFSDMDYEDISSTQIRSAIKEGRDAKGLVPKKVLEYIKQNKLYG